MGLSKRAHIPLNNFMLFSELLMKEKFHWLFRSWKERLLIIIEDFFRLSSKNSAKSSTFSTGLPKKLYPILRQDWFQRYKQNFLMQFIGADISISRRRFFAKFKILASKSLTEETKIWKKFSGKLCLWVSYHWGKFEMLLWIYWTKSPPGLFSSDTQNYEIFSNIFIIHGFWLFHQKCKRFWKTFQDANNKYLRRMELFLEP